MFRLDTLAAVVTGASSGIGLAVASAFLDAGATVLGVDQTVAPASLSDRPGFTGLSLDLTEPGAAEQVLGALPHGRLDVLVNNAGIGNAAPIHETDDAAYDRYVAVNQTALFRLSRAAVRAMRASGGGAIVNISSVFALVGAARSAPIRPPRRPSPASPASSPPSTDATASASTPSRRA